MAELLFPPGTKPTTNAFIKWSGFGSLQRRLETHPQTTPPGRGSPQYGIIQGLMAGMLVLSSPKMGCP